MNVMKLLQDLPSSSVGTNFDAMDLMAMKDVPFNISTMAPENEPEHS